MRGFLVAMLVAAVVVAGALAWWSGTLTPTEPSLGPGPGANHPGATDPIAPAPHASSTPTASTLGPNLVATRTAPPILPAEKLADSPTACLFVVDRTTKQPLASAPIRRLQGGAEIAFTDERGFAPVALREPEQLAVVVDGYLLRLVPTRLGTSEAEPQQVMMVRDEWSLVRRCEFAAPDGSAVPEAFVRFRPRSPTRNAPSPVPAGDAIAQRAFQEHTMLASLPVCADAPVVLGSWAEDRVHRLANGAGVRFVAAGEYVLEVATTSGLVARHEVRIEPPPRTDASPIRIALRAGAFATGVVTNTNGAPLAGAMLTLEGGEPLGLVATTTADGAFRFGPLVAEPVTLLVKHGDHEPKAFGPVPVPATDVRIALVPLPQTALRGRVRARPDLRPIAGATVVWMPRGAPTVSTTTAADGTFALRAPGANAERLAVQALGHVAYAELVDPGSAFADYDLWPADPQQRLAHGLSAMLEGIVVDAEGRPVAGCDVRWLPAHRPAPAALPGRRVLEGGVLELPLGGRSGEDGAFRIETNAFGPGRLARADGTGQTAEVTAIAGRASTGIRLAP